MRILRQELLGSARERPEDMPLLRAADGERNALAWRDRECTMAQLLHAATALAAALPPGRRVLVACEDRAVFLWVLLALWAARRTAVMPSPDLKFGSDGVEDAAFDSIVTDRTDLQHGAVATLRVSLARLQQELVAAQQPPVPSLALPSAHPAVVFFTSGSTGRPTMQAKTWGQLCEAADAMAALLRMQDARALLAGTVVHSHMFGFEMLVMQVLRGSCTLYAHRIVYPSDLAAFAAQPGARKWLVSTPYHLQVFADGGPLPAGLARVVSATMPLTAELAARVEADSGAEVHEIYGSTEAGCIAKRRTVAGESWALAPDLRLRIDADGAATLHGARLGCALRLRDRITVTDDGFELNGRDTDMVKVAGKRTSLQALSAILRDIDGVHDGVFVDGTALGQTRLAAIAVAPGLAAETIRDTLASRIDAAFLPRPLVLVPELPRDANGKLLADLIAPAIAEARAAARRRPVLTVQPQHT